MTTDTPRSIVTYVHRPKRPPRKDAQAVAITGPAIVTGKSERTHRQVADVLASDEPAAIVTATPRRTRIVVAGSATCPI
jgi:hypothetical protein